MANKSYKYTILWGWREDGNRTVEALWEGTATSVPRAISKLVKELNDDDGAGDGAQDVKISDLFILDVRCAQMTESLNFLKQGLTA